MSSQHRVLSIALVLGLAAACTSIPQPGTGPARSVRLSADVRPLHYGLELSIDPGRSDFSGVAQIRVTLARSTRSIAMHGLDLDVGTATVESRGEAAIPATWKPVGRSGAALLELAEAVGPGEVEIRIAYRGRFGQRLRGLYRVEVAGDAYAFTQFEPVSARQAFPGFDEPGFKTPFDVTLVIPEGAVAIGNSPVAGRETLPSGEQRIRFATTPPLPTYLLAWAVGPLDVVEAPAIPPGGARDRAIPLRGAAVRGRGSELATALRQTPAILEALELWFGTPYPYAKLDVIAVPDFGAGAMENPGAIFFREEYLLLDGDGAGESERRAFGYIMAHELAHQWFGNLVTMAWWNDLWLNESFATWMGRRIEGEVYPESDADGALLQSVHGAMRADDLVSARSIRQPVNDAHDIYNAFDGITYSKGGGVLGMFERWLGPETFRAGVTGYLDAHHMGNASAEDLLGALSAAAGRDVETPFRSFLTQPGVPLVEAAVSCGPDGARIRLRQSRHLPTGSTGERDVRWQIPVCIRYGRDGATGEQCHLLTSEEEDPPIPGGCPDWVMPNADGAGYYRFALGEDDWERLRRDGWDHLTPRERLSAAENLEVGFRSGGVPAAAVYSSLPVLAADPYRRVAKAPIDLLRLAQEHLVAPERRPAVQAFGAALYRPRLARIGWDPGPDESGETRLLRATIIDYLALDARDPATRRDAASRGRQYAGLDPPGGDTGDLDPEGVEAALSVAVQEGGRPVFDELLGSLGTTRDAARRRRLLRALAATEDPELAERARALALDRALRVNEVWSPLYRQAQSPANRDATWSWIEAHYDELVARAGNAHSGWMPWLAAGFCDRERADAVEDFLAPRIDALPGGPRNLAGSVEAIRLCANLRERQGAATDRFFSAPR